MTTYGRIAVTLSLLLDVSGCVGSTAEPVGYDPVPDEQLFADVEALPGVRSVDLVYTNTFTNPSEYSGDVTRDPRGVLVDSGSVGVTSPGALEERYGPQPGTGEVPADVAPLPRPPSLR